jgi:hypothetical protein
VPEVRSWEMDNNVVIVSRLLESKAASVTKLETNKVKVIADFRTLRLYLGSPSYLLHDFNIVLACS